MIYVKACHEEYISQVATASIGTGILGVMGNKGAVAIRFCYKESIFCFVNSHLAADSSMVEKRNQDYRDISSRLDFPINSLKNFEEYCIKFPWIPVNWSSITVEMLRKSSLSIFDAEYVTILVNFI